MSHGSAAALAWPLIGRDAELATVAQALDSDASHGVLISGAAGIGRTRFSAEAALVAAESKWSVYHVVGTAAAQSVPLGALAYWAGRIDGAPPQTVHEVITAISATAETAKVVLRIDDAHLLDDLSAYVVYQLVQTRLVKVIITVRSGAPSPDAVLKLWTDGLLRRLDLTPLSRADFDALLRAALHGRTADDCAARLWELTHGNLAFLTELVRQAIADGTLVEHNDHWQLNAEPAISPALADIIGMHIGETPEPLREVMDLAAAAGAVNRGHLNTIADPDTIAAAERRGLIIADDDIADSVRIAHPLYARMILARCGPLQMRRLHGRLATAMMSTPSTADPVDLGLLWLKSDLPGDPDVLSDAAEAALERLDLDAAGRCAHAAVAAGAGPRMVLLQALSYYLSGRRADAHRAFAAVDSEALGPNDLHIHAQLAALIAPPVAHRLRTNGRRAHQINAVYGLRSILAGDPINAIEVTDTVDHRGSP